MLETEHLLGRNTNIEELCSSQQFPLRTRESNQVNQVAPGFWEKKTQLNRKTNKPCHQSSFHVLGFPNLFLQTYRFKKF